MVRQLPNPQSDVQHPLPPLESGDRLARPEFERRYAATPHIKKAELIEGIVYVASPLRFQQHAEPHSRLLSVLQEGLQTPEHDAFVKRLGKTT